MSNKKVSIVILNWNNIDDSIEVLESLKKVTYSNYQIILVDNGSKEPEGDLLKEKYPYIELFKNPENFGFTGGCNTGIKEAMEDNSDYVLLLNNDIKVSPNFLDLLVAEAESDPKIGIVGPKLYFYDRPKEIAFGGGSINLFTGEAKHLKLEEKQEVDYIEGSSMLIKAELLEKIKGLDEEYFSYWEDADFCVKTRKEGYKIVYQPKAELWHKVSSSTGGDLSPFSIYYLTRNRLIFMRRHAKFYNYLFFVPFYILDSLRYFLLFKNTARIKSYLRGFRDGLTYKIS